MAEIRGRCPSCLAQSLTLARDGIVACSAPGCRDRGAANYLLHGGDMALVSLLGGGARARMMAESLAVDGITYSKLASVTDAELDRTPGINSTAIARIREVFPAPGAPCCRPVEAVHTTNVGLGCPCHAGDERCSGCRRCPDVCAGCDVTLVDLAREHPEAL